MSQRDSDRYLVFIVMIPGTWAHYGLSLQDRCRGNWIPGDFKTVAEGASRWRRAVDFLRGATVGEA